jgi:transcriptional regulator with XRE-family HTH domain
MTKLARYLDDHGITQSALARRSGVNRRTVGFAVAGEASSGHETSLDTWAKLSRALGCNVYDISEDAYSRLVGSV